MKLISPLLLTLLICSSLVGCGEKNELTTNTPPEAKVEKEAEAKVQLANPASEYCVSLGGTLEIKQTPEGQQGICTLPSGEKIDEWALFRRDHQQDKKQ